MGKTGWIYNVTNEIAIKAALGDQDLSHLGQIEKIASIKLGLKRCKKKDGENIGHYAHRLIKHFGLDVKYLKNKMNPKKPIVERTPAQKMASVYNKKYAGMHMGRFGAASKVRSIDLSTVDLSKYLEKP